MKTAEKWKYRYLKNVGGKLDAGKNPFDVKAAFWILKHFTPLKPKKAAQNSGEYLDGGKTVCERIRETTADAFTEDGFIGSQRKLSYLPFSAEGNTADHGCGWISVFNALKLLGMEEQPETLLHEMSFGARNKGKGGVNPFFVYCWLKQKGFRVSIVTGTERMNRAGRRVPAFILCYLYLGSDEFIGGHFEAGCWEDGFHIYNGERPGCVVYEKIEDTFSKSALFKMMITIEPKKEDCR